MERLPGGFKVIDANGQSLAYFYARQRSRREHRRGADHGRGKTVGEQLRQAAGAARPRLKRRLQPAPPIGMLEVQDLGASIANRL